MDGLLDKWILLYVVIAGGLTELIMRVTPDDVSRRKYAGLITIAAAELAAITHGLSTGVAIEMCFFRGLLAAALSSAGYGYIKSAVLGWIKPSGGTAPPQ
jgi:hypothetical protein